MISIVVPVFQESESLGTLYDELTSMAASSAGDWEFVFVDDGSTDGTWGRLQELVRRDRRVRAVRLKRNFGQTPAMACGIDVARGDVVVTMDGDLQNDPADIPRLLAKLDEGYDVACGWRYRRQDKLVSRKLPSWAANRLIGWLTGVPLHDYGCSLKAYRSAAIKRTPLYAEFHRFIPALATLTGALVTEIKVNHRPRQHGKTKYTISRAWRVALDMLTVASLIKFSSKPLRLFGALSLAAFAVSLFAITRAWQAYLVSPEGALQIAAGVGMLALWLAGHLAVTGLMAELSLASAHRRTAELLAVSE